MLVKRILSLVLGFAFTIWVVIWTNQIMVNLVIGVFTLIAVHELDKAFRQKQIKPITYISYALTAVIYIINTLCYLNIIKMDILIVYAYIVLPIAILSLFIAYVIKHHKYTIMDVGVTLLQMAYPIFLFTFITNIYSLANGKMIIWYIFIGSWFTDIFAFCIGKTFGKTTFTSISPKKTIEGCMGGVLGAVIGFGVFTYIINRFFCLGINYTHIIVLAIVCSIVSQVGDLFASSIKRFTGIKDFGNVFPGHGGMIDRFDSTLFIAPLIFAYFYFLI